MPIIVIFLSCSITLACAIIIALRQNTDIVYADSIQFNTDINGINVYIGNQLTLDNVIVEPTNCGFSPVFTAKKIGEQEEVITFPYSFMRVGKHIIKCKIKANDNYMISDTISVNVTNDVAFASMYILSNTDYKLYVGDAIDLSKVVTISAPSDANVSVTSNSNITIKDNIVTADESGVGKIYVAIKYHGIEICETAYVTIENKPVESDIDIILTVGQSVLIDNIVEINSLDLCLAVNYMFTKIDNQTLSYVENSEVFDIVSCDAPIIIIQPLKYGEGILYVSPTEYQNRVFKILIKVCPQ